MRVGVLLLVVATIINTLTILILMFDILDLSKRITEEDERRYARILMCQKSYEEYKNEGDV